MNEAVAAQTKRTSSGSHAVDQKIAIQRKCACGQHTVAGGECEACRKKRLKLQRWDKHNPGPALLTTNFAAANTITPRFGVNLTDMQLRTPQSLIQRQPRGETGQMPTEAADQNGEAAPTTSTNPTTTAAAPAPTTAEPATEPAAPEATATPSLLVADEATELGEGQMRKSEFLAELQTAVCAAADAELAAVGRNTEGCPYLDYWFDYYEQQDATHGERALRRYAPEAANATSARAYIPIVAERIRQGVARWASTGEISGIPAGIPLRLPGSGLLGGLSGLAAGVGNLFFKARAGSARKTDDPQAVQAQLGDGRPLDSGVRSRMESAFGTSFSHVRLHNDSKAAHLSSDQNARAFAVGKHIAFGAGEYQPGTLLGDGLIAHELAHVVQQRSATETVANMNVGEAGYESLERDADDTAVNAVTFLWDQTKERLSSVRHRALPQLNSGLQLQRCATRRPTTTTPTPTTSSATTNCPPTLVDPSWDVAPAPILRPVSSQCNLQLAHSSGQDGMEFSSLARMTPGCPGSIYFAQYVQVNRVMVNCFEGRALGTRFSHSGGIDTSWPYGEGSNINTSITSGTEERRIQTRDSPGQQNISNPEIALSRLCLNDHFVTYIVFEDDAHNLTPLGWTEWQYNAQAWRDSGNCPLSSTASDCTGWNVTGTGSKVGESFVPGAAHSSIALNRSAPLVTPATFTVSDATPDECPVPAADAGS